MAKLQLVLLILAMLCVSFSAVFADQTPGTVSDPLVSKSYLDHFFRFRSLVVPANSTIKPEPGALVIVRSGQVILRGPKGKAIVDLTAGKEIGIGEALPLNHLLIVPDSADYELHAPKLSLLLASCLQHQNN